MKRILPGLACLLLGLATACSGSLAPGVRLAYADPGPAPFRLLRNAALSDDSRLVLDLVGPSDLLGRGLSFTLRCDPRMEAVKVSPDDAECVQNGTVFELGPPPQLLKALHHGDLLEVTLSQRGQGNARRLGGVLARLALQLRPSADLPTGLRLSVTDCLLLPASGAPVPVEAVVGVLEARMEAVPTS
jgi:hypothetical protein